MGRDAILVVVVRGAERALPDDNRHVDFDIDVGVVIVEVAVVVEEREEEEVLSRQKDAQMYPDFLGGSPRCPTPLPSGNETHRQAHSMTKRPAVQ
jgi:hypothetical protein